jgi:UPF0755 protein
VKKLLLTLSVLIMVTAAVLGLYARSGLQAVGSPAEGGIVEIPHGLGARGVVGLLAEKKVIASRPVALAFIFSTGKWHKLQAGEYLFDRPMTIPEVIGKIASGSVLLHKFTVPEGLTLAATAQKWEEQGFGSAVEFMTAAGQTLDAVRRFDDKAMSTEGYLFPETYSFRRHTTARVAVGTMVERFRQIVARLEQAVPRENWPLQLHDAVILASLVESEAARPDERALIASVYLNRLSRRILLQCDPTVIYALQQADRYRGTLTLVDLQFPSPYNTYKNVGLPPGPISNPGYPSLLAAIQPAATQYLYFVRTRDAYHTFSETLAAHNRAVEAYRKMRKAPPG